MTRRVQDLDEFEMAKLFREYAEANAEITFKQLCDGFKDWEDQIPAKGEA